MEAKEMRRINLRVVILLAMAFLLSYMPLPAGAADVYDKARIVARTRIWRDINSGKACSAAVAIMDDGKIVYSEGFGMADREKSIPVGGNTLFNIGSISKVYDATAIMLLVDEGRVRLDDPVTKYLPDFVMADPRYKDITVRMLLNHSSGLPGTTGGNNFGFRYNTDVFKQTLDNLSTSHLMHSPGEMAPYTNDGFTLAEMIVERVSGRRFIEYLKEKVFTPLSLENTGLSVGEWRNRSLAAYYYPDTGKKEPPEVVSLLGAGGLGASAEDLCRFQDIFSGKGKQIFSSSSLEEMRKLQPSAFDRKLMHPQVTYGLGWDITGIPSFKSLQILGKSGGTGKYTTMMFTVPSHRISVAVLESAESGSAMEIALDIIRAVLVQKGLLQDQTPAISKPPIPQPIPAKYAAFEGYYAPLQKIGFDFKKNTVILRTFDEGQEAETISLIYNDGYFYDEKGHQSYFATVDGEDYYVSYMSEFGMDRVVAQKLKKPDRPLSLRADINGKRWLRRNVKWFEGTMGRKGHIAKSSTLADLPGYVIFDGVKVILSPDFAGMPVGNLRDQSELTLIDRNGKTWARLSELLYSPADAAVPFKEGIKTLTIGREGYNEWLETGDDIVLSFEKPVESKIIVFSPKGSSIYDSAIDTGAVFAPKGSLIEFAGNNGDECKVSAR